MVDAGVQNSGGYFNPAATTAVWLLGRCPSADLPGCLVPQVVAAAAAAVAALSLEPERFGLKEKGTVWPQNLAKSRCRLVVQPPFLRWHELASPQQCCGAGVDDSGNMKGKANEKV
jgi:hypothetical protein